MKQSSLGSAPYGVLSIILGVVSFPLYFAEFTFTPIAYVAAIVGLVGFLAGAASVKTKSGAVGIGLNVLAGLFMLSMVLTVHHLFNK